MPPVRSLYLAPRVAPLASGEDAEVAAALSRSLVRAGEQVVVVTRRPPDARAEDLDAAGLARRLDPLELTGPHGGAALTVREGRLAGEVPVFVIEGDGAEDDEVLAGAALDLAWRRDLWPDVVRAWDHAPHICAQAEERAAPPGRSVPAALLLVDDASVREVSSALRDALAAADRVVLPSRAYAGEILETGEGELVDLLRAAPDKVRGVPAGIDEARWSPVHDPQLSGSAASDPATRAALARSVRRDVGLPPTDGPLICVPGDASLLDRDAGAELARSGAQLVFAHAPGTAPGAEQLAQDLARAHPTRVRSVTAPAPLLHRLLVAADLALFCHEFTPGTFSPLWCMRYGTVPIVPRSGGFADAVVEWDAVTRTGSGFLYRQHRPESIPTALRRALRAAASIDTWRLLVARTAAVDLSWRTAGVRHAELGRDAVRSRPRDRP